MGKFFVISLLNWPERAMVNAMAIEITSRDELEAWLDDKPQELARVLSRRAAVRLAPIIMDTAHSKDGRLLSGGLVLPAVRAIAVSWMVTDDLAKSLNAPEADVADAIKFASSDANGRAGDFGQQDDEASFYRAEADLILANEDLTKATDAAAAERARIAADKAKATMAESRAYEASIQAVAYALTEIANLAARGANAIGGWSTGAERYHLHALNGVNDTQSPSAFWKAVQDDCLAFDSGASPDELLHRPIFSSPPGWWTETLDRALNRLSSSSAGFDIWREWLQGRIQGRPRAFDGFDDDSDRKFYAYLVEQDDSWWKRGDGAVNADIKAKVEELRQPKPLQIPDLENLAQRLEAVEASTETVSAGDIADLKLAIAEVLEASKRARQEPGQPTIGHNSGAFEGESLAREMTLAMDAVKRIEEQIQGIDARLAELQKDLERPDLTKGELAKQGKGFVERLDLIRKISPEFFNAFEKTLGVGAAGGFTAWLANMLGLLESIARSVGLG
ncbi:MAG: hypothetical protein AAFY19_03995 [Pseudomonadota bacterium]